MLKSKIDIIITSGAVSAGKFDFVPKVVNNFKLSNFFKSVAIRPGKPILFAKIRGTSKANFWSYQVIQFHQLLALDFLFIPYLRNLLGIKEEISFKAILKNEFEKKRILPVL